MEGVRRTLKLIWTVAILGLALVPAASAQTGTRCEFKPTPPPPAATGKPSAQPSRLQEKAVRFTRGGKRGYSDRSIVFPASPPLAQDADVFAEVTGDLDKADASDSFDEEGIVVQRSITQAGDLKLKVCIDPEKPEHVAAGRYVGTIRISGRDVQPTGMSLEVTLRRSTLLAVLLLVGGALFGIVAKAFGDRQSTEKTLAAAPDSAGLHFTWREYLKSAGFIGGVLGGLALCVVAYVQIYDADPDWGTGLDMVTLALAAAAAMVSGRTVADVVAPYVPKPKK